MVGNVIVQSEQQLII